MTQQLVMPEGDLERKAAAIKMLSLGLLVAQVVVAVGMGIARLFDPAFPIIPVVILIGIFMLVTLASHWLNRSGRTIFASYFFVTGCILLASAVTAQLGGFTGPMAVAFLFPILVSGIIISVNASLYVATVATILYLGIIPLELSGVVPQVIFHEGEMPAFPVVNAVVKVIIFYLVAFLSWFAARRLNHALQHVSSFAAELQTANEKLHAKEDELTAFNEELTASNEELRSTEEELRSSNEELREAQQHLVRSEKLAAIGQLAGGVGHELRNPLGAIKNAVYYIKGRLEKNDIAQQEPRVMEFLSIVDDEINSSNKIINDLLNYSRVNKLAASQARIERVINDALIHVQIPENIELVKNIDADLPQVSIDTDQIRQVLINIMTNAVQAMSEGGKLTIEAETDDRFLYVKVIDSGTGIPGEALGKVFDPLYTMKAKGIGLGLAVCKSIIDRHDGLIEVTSIEGKGTTFTVKLPLKTE